MKKLFAIACMAMLACALAVFAGCGQAGGPTGGIGTMTSGMRASQDGVRVAVIDVGKGDCILVQAGGSSVLIDTGYDYTSDEVVSYLRGQGVSQLEALVITHYDKDHIGGIRDIGHAFGIGTIYLPGYTGGDKQYRSAMAAIDELGVATRRVTARQTLKLGDASLSILPSSLTYIPDAKGDEGNDDDLSLVETLTFGDDSYLFVADREQEGLEAYLKDPQGQFDVLKVPDHGKKRSNTEEFLDSVRPQIALITDGEDDPADKKTLKLLQSCGATVYRTSERGTIVVESDGAGHYSVG